MASIDPVAFARTLLVSLQAGTDIASWPVRAGRLLKGDAPVAGGAGVILIQEAGGLRHARLPVWQPFRVAVRSYGTDEDQAAKGLRVVSDLLHRRRNATTADGRLYAAFDETGPQVGQDPRTEWPFAFGVFNLHLADQ